MDIETGALLTLAAHEQQIFAVVMAAGTTSHTLVALHWNLQLD